MKGYRKNAYGLKYIVYDEPITMSKKELLDKYSEGGIVFFKSIKIESPEGAEDGFEVYGHEKYIHNFTEVEYINHTRAKERERFIDCDRCIIIPKESMYLLPTPFVMSQEAFLTDKDHYIDKYFFLCKSKYGAGDEDVKIIIRADNEHDGVIVYGFGFRDLLPDEEAVIGKGYESLSIKNYHECRTAYFEWNIEDDLCDPFEDYADEESVVSEEEIIQKADVKQQIKIWLNRTNFKHFSDYVTGKVMGQENAKKVAMYVYNYLKGIAKDAPNTSNIMLTAPSGCGKTETFRAIKAYFEKEIPKLIVYQLDMTSITEEGFKGNDTNAIVAPLLENAECNGIGIVFLDEFDKKIVPSVTSKGQNVNAAVQAQILTLIEGREVLGKQSKIDTNNTMFVALGSFDECRAKKKEVIHHVGFGQKNEGGLAHYTDISRDDIIELGGSYEIVGRFAAVLNYHELDDAVVDRIIDYNVEQLGKANELELSISGKMREHLHSIANGKYGCRIIASTIKDSIVDAMIRICELDETDCSWRVTIEAPGVVDVISVMPAEERGRD